MDPAGARRACAGIAVLSVVLIVVGAAIWYLGHTVAGVLVMVAFIAVLVVCLGVMSLVNRLAFHSMMLSAGRKKDRRGLGFPEALADPRRSLSTCSCRRAGAS